MVVQAWRQVSGRDSGGIFAPVCGVHQSIRMVLATVAENGRTVWQLEVQSARRFADVEEKEGYVKTGPEYETEHETTGRPLAMKLLESLYGLKQSPSIWHGIVDPFVSRIGFKALKLGSNPSLAAHASKVLTERLR